MRQHQFESVYSVTIATESMAAADDTLANISDEDIEDCVSYSSGDSSDDSEDESSINSQISEWRQTCIEDDIHVSLPQFYGISGINPLFESCDSISEIFNLFFLRTSSSTHW